MCIGPASSLHALARSLQPLFSLIRIDSHRCFSVWSDLGVALDLFSNFKWVGSSGYLSERLGYITTVSGPFLVSRTHCSWFFACVYSSRILPARSLQPLLWLISIDSHRCFSVWSDVGVALDLGSNFKWVGASGYLSRIQWLLEWTSGRIVSGRVLVSRTGDVQYAWHAFGAFPKLWMGRIQWLLEWTQILPLSLSRAAVRGTLLSVFRPLFHMTNNVKKQEQCAKNNLTNKRGERPQIFKIVFFVDLSVDSGEKLPNKYGMQCWGALRYDFIGGCRLKWGVPVMSFFLVEIVWNPATSVAVG